MSLLSSVNESAPGAPYSPDIGNLPYGVSYNLCWSVLLNNPPTLASFIEVPGLTSNAPISANVQLRATTQSNITDANGCRLTAVAVELPYLYFYVTASGGGTGGRPSDNSNFGISWSVTGD